MSSNLKTRAEAAMPGGVNSPVRAFKSVGGNPIFARRAEGAILETVDGRKLVDYCMSFGPLILGHGHPKVIEAVEKALRNGMSFAVTTEAEIEMAEMIISAIPAVEKVRLVNSGTEACMTALRLARGFTGRPKILKFTGCYHGHSDGLLVEAGSGVAGIATASSAGVPESIAVHTIVAPYNDFDAIARIVAEHGPELAAIAVEPVAGNMGVVLPKDGYLQHLRKLCDECGALLICDEVMTGFRVHFGGVHQQYGITPDLVCLGKIIGGGMPIGAVGGRADIMDRLAPVGDVYQAGTLSGNPVSVACGLATLRLTKELDPYPVLRARTQRLEQAVRSGADKKGIPVQVHGIGSMYSFFFSADPVTNFAEALAIDKETFNRLFHGLMERGIYLPPSAYEASFPSIAHTDEIIERTAEAMDAAFAAL